MVYGNINYLQDGVFILETDSYGDIPEPDYHSQGMGCGLEDRNITDRYDAMVHGWEKAVERYQENLPCFIEVIPDSVSQLLYTTSEGLEFYDGDIVSHSYYPDCSMRIYFSDELLAVVGQVFDDRGEYELVSLLPADFEKRIVKI